MTGLQELVFDLRRRGVSLRILENQRLAIAPVEKLSPDELGLVREYKLAILRLLAPERQQQRECPGDECSEVITVIDGCGYCPSHRMAVIFMEESQ